MDKENDIPPIKGFDEISRDLSEKKDLRTLAIDVCVGDFEQNYHMFRRFGEMQKATLAVFDFESIDPKDSSSSNSSMRAVLPSERLFIVDYSVLLNRFIRIFKKDMVSLGHLGVARAERVPDIDTPNSLKFVEENPGQKAGLEFMIYPIDTDWNMNEMVLRERFLRPQTRDKISEAWIAFRTENTL